MRGHDKNTCIKLRRDQRNIKLLRIELEDLQREIEMVKLDAKLKAIKESKFGCCKVNENKSAKFLSPIPY
jgi:hypothetical protein